MTTELHRFRPCEEANLTGPGRTATWCPQETFIVLVTLWQLSDLERAYNVESDRELLGQSPRRPVSLWPTTMSRLPATGVN